MARQRISVEVKSSVLKWAISTSGMNFIDISKKISDKEDTISKWLSKQSKPTLKQLEKLSKIVTS